MINRRHFMRHLGGLSTLGIGTYLSTNSSSAFSASLSGYKAIIAIHLAGGNDGNNTLIPMDAAYNDYQAARPVLALAKTEITPLSGSFMGHTFGMNQALAPLLPSFNAGTMAFITNVGPLIQPTTAAQALKGSVQLPSYLYSHPEQQEMVNGWAGTQDPSGWGGRGIEAMDPTSSLTAPLISLNGASNNLALGRHSPLMNAYSSATRYIGQADLATPSNPWTQVMGALSRIQSSNPIENEYAKAFSRIYNNSSLLLNASMSTPTPSGFGTDSLSAQLSMVTKLMSYFSANGASRQIYSLQWGGFDTHTNQRGTSTIGNMGQDGQLATVANALVSLQNALAQANLSNNVAILVNTEFARTLDPASGAGSDHAWGNHWMVLGTPVKGAQVYGNTFPSLVKGGVDDASPQKRGYWVPQYSSDQVAADLLLWLGLQSSSLTSVMPNLNNFTNKTIGFMNS